MDQEKIDLENLCQSCDIEPIYMNGLCEFCFFDDQENKFDIKNEKTEIITKHSQGLKSNSKLQEKRIIQKYVKLKKRK